MHMKKSAVLILAATLSVTMPAQPLNAQGVRDEVMADINKAGGLHYVYDYKADPPATKPPKGYKPFYVSHLSRHGARYQFTQYDSLDAWFRWAGKEGILTPYGKAFAQKYFPFYEKVRLRGGSLTSIGMDQHKTIAARMFRNYPEVFKGQTAAWAVATESPRVILSMMCFLDTLKTLDRTFDASFDASLALCPFLQPNHRSSPTYVRHPRVNAQTEKMNHRFFYSTVPVKGICDRFFTDTVKLSDRGVSMRRFLIYLHDVTDGMQCLDHDRDLFKGTFTPEEEYALFCCENLDDAIFLANYKGSGAVYYLMSAYTLKHIIETADSDMASGEHQLRLRFCHDSQILPLLNIMNVNGMGREITSPEEASEIYPRFNVPMGASLQFIFFRSRKDPEVLFKLLLNEREATLPLDAVDGPYYRWSDFKARFVPCIEASIKKLDSIREASR